MMWIICMFDIPVRTKTEMRKATRFRNLLKNRYYVYTFCQWQISLS